MAPIVPRVHQPGVQEGTELKRDSTKGHVGHRPMYGPNRKLVFPDQAQDLLTTGDAIAARTAVEVNTPLV
jgi:hypothetical protein